MKLSPAKKAVLMSYLRGILASAVSYALANAANIDPRLAIVVGAVSGPAAKYFDSNEKTFGKGSK